MNKILCRSPYDGDPFYCTTCRLGFNEYGACEEVGCQLESKKVSRQRKAIYEVSRALKPVLIPVEQQCMQIQAQNWELLEGIAESVLKRFNKEYNK